MALVVFHADQTQPWCPDSLRSFCCGRRSHPHPAARGHGRARLPHVFLHSLRAGRPDLGSRVSKEEAFRKDLRGRYDALVLYRRLREDLARKGRRIFGSSWKSGPASSSCTRDHQLPGLRLVPVTSLAAATCWTRFDGKRASTYLHDQDMSIRVVTPHSDHPGTLPDARPRRDLQRNVDRADEHRSSRHGQSTSDVRIAWISAYKRHASSTSRLTWSGVASRSAYRRVVRICGAVGDEAVGSRRAAAGRLARLAALFDVGRRVALPFPRW
jgi:hypothetical protein